MIYLLQDNSMAVELASCLSGGGDLGREGQTQSGELSDLSQESHQSVTVVDPQLPVAAVKLHQSTTRLQTKVCRDMCCANSSLSHRYKE